MEIVPGEGATIRATTAEGQAFQMLSFLQNQEENQTINPLEEEYFTGTKNTDTNNRFFEGSWKIPAIFTPTGMITAVEVYQGIIFSPGTGGTFTALTPMAYALEVLFSLIYRQNDNNYNPDKYSYVTGKYDFNLRLCEGNFKLPYQTILLPNGGTQDTARPYLL